MTRITEACTGRCQEPRFSGPIIHDDELAHRLRRLHRTLASGDAIDPLEAKSAVSARSWNFMDMRPSRVT